MSNAKHASPDLVLELDRPRKACFNLRAMNALEQHYEKETGQKQLWKALDWQNIGTRELTRILWASLLTDAEDAAETLTYEHVEKIATAAALISNADKFMALINELMDRAMPVMDSEEMTSSLEQLQKKTTKLAQKRKLRATVTTGLAS